MNIISRSIALLFLIILSPFLIIISFLCLIFQGHPIFFRQQRIGYNYKPFMIYKFRTMVNNAGESISYQNDVRVTIIGKILRKAKIDEIPQLINIIKGEMRFIGPRPEIPEYFEKNKFKFLKKIKPGISDFASIILRNESHILEKIGGENPYKKLLPIKIKLANYYAIKKSFLLDLRLVIVTILCLIFPYSSVKVFVLPMISDEVPDIHVFFTKYLDY